MPALLCEGWHGFLQDQGKLDQNSRQFKFKLIFLLLLNMYLKASETIRLTKNLSLSLVKTTKGDSLRPPPPLQIGIKTKRSPLGTSYLVLQPISHNNAKGSNVYKGSPKNGKPFKIRAIIQRNLVKIDTLQKSVSRQFPVNF